MSPSTPAEPFRISIRGFITRLKSPTKTIQESNCQINHQNVAIVVGRETRCTKGEHVSSLATSLGNNSPSTDQSLQQDRDPSSLETKSSTRFIRTQVGTMVSKIGLSVSNILFGAEPSSTPPERRVRGGVLLYGCTTTGEHWHMHDTLLNRLQSTNGIEGLREAGLQCRLVPCEKHKMMEQEEKKEEPFRSTSERDVSCVHETNLESTSDEAYVFCEDCITRLFHIASNIPVTAINRKIFIADGRMYDEISRCCESIAHERMITEGDLEWVEIDPATENQPAIRALVSRGYRQHPTRPILLIVTGKGKVQAGIFSRQHIMTSGLEPSCAIYQILEAKKREWTVVLLDPNARGEQMAMTTIQQSMENIFDFIEQREPATREMQLYIQAHSASGSHVVRYLMEKGEFYLNHIRGIVFTDSTHNIQWCRTKNLPHLLTFLESSTCIYFRSTNTTRDNDWRTHRAGQLCPSSDEYWERRFGKVQTFWAGTTEHSLSDWNARHFIWYHFDNQSVCKASLG